ncbi:MULTISPECIES: type II toxin-antitoxin system RelE/ParE family toxin [unclassified Wenzhouxiangella]|uniref:type II toxin-antitoxin system RelE/ParE family toxin n=1 Tax=unclassified Wenzhouxiangella TaxID=2613841 RepID=UPI000E3288FB|nr:type II toxin-antitoxin system RelE/ParE family toxin [Wenzhouxiangella sp. 15181]RFF27796.1 type II toxin-antitoxin system RelE/ParE family toxin [Wenzhouxiangella sp. 15181]RFP70361.1 type II toxin-antitoxin system RelE/ParE family toxin [Wenzhouxiangella sp. 15190]
MSYRFHPSAEAEFLDAVSYYESRAFGLGAAFIAEFEALANLIAESPKAWQVELRPDIRSAPLRRFPVSIIYREQLNGFEILAVAHQRRHPQYWLGRT